MKNMFNRKKIKELEQKIEGISELLQIKWKKKDTYDSYSPPTIFYVKYKASYVDVTKELLKYLNLEICEEPSKPATIKIVKKKIK